jgi:hypothetical protein
MPQMRIRIPDGFDGRHEEKKKRKNSKGGRSS